MTQRRSFLVAWFSIACLAVVGIASLIAAEAGELPRITGVQVTDLAGQKHSLDGNSSADKAKPKLTVLVFLGTQCPVSNGYAPALRRLYEAQKPGNVSMLGVHCDPDVTADLAQSHAREYELPFPLVLDHDQHLAQACGVKIVPTAVLIAADGRLLYRGRIDNRFVSNGLRRPEATVFDLQFALDSALAGQQPNPCTTETVGCPLPPARR